MSGSKHLEWLDLKRPPAERLESFRAWVARLLYKKLFFSENPEVCARQIGQCEAIVMQTVAELEQRHFRLDGEALKSWIEDKVSHIADYQAKGQVHNLYVYFKRSWTRYVEQQAEELRETVKKENYERLVKGLKTIPELTLIVQEARLRESLIKRRQRADKTDAGKQQQTLF